MKTNQVLLNVVPIRSEHASYMKGCTHNCTHVPVMLDKGTPMIIYPQRLKVSERRTLEVALCPDCYLRIRGANN
jgi:hypothetical protein